VEDDAVLFVQGTNEVTHFRTQHAFHRPRFQSDDMDLDVARAQ
jgi:hypothetical protein